jgi:hypothetical protein
MGLQDELRGVTKQAQEASTVNPNTSNSRAGYFDWGKHHSQGNKNEAIGIILPPYATYIDERVAAIKAGKKFLTPFSVTHGLHAIGPQKGNKFYCNCRKTLVEGNNENGLVGKHILDGGADCPICSVAWDEVWPECEKHGKESNEYKHLRGFHKWVTPQKKILFNFLPAGTSEPVMFDAAKTLGMALEQIHYDPKQPDLLWPVPNLPAWNSSWVQITKVEEDAATKYLVNTVYVGQPHVIDGTGMFNEEMYRAIVSKVPDLRKLADSLVPDAITLQKAMDRVDQGRKQYSFGVSVDKAVAAQVENATAGMTGGVAASRPPMAPSIPMIPGQVPPVAAGVPMIPGQVPPATPSAAATPSSTQAHALLTELMNQGK